MDTLKTKISQLAEKPTFRILLTVLFLWVLGSFSIIYFENGDLAEVGNAIWWTIVTITTVGYGDYSPSSVPGRILAVIIMFSGIGLISVLTGSISSIFTTKKIMEGRGLENLKLKDHIVICGWNSNIEKVLSNMGKLSSEGNHVKIAMINDMGEDQMNSIIARFNSESLKIYFVRGDYALESILDKACIDHAKSAVIISDDTVENDDDKTILTVLTIKNKLPNLKVVAHVSQQDKLPYLKRAKADEVIVNDTYESFMAATHVLEPGVPQAVNQLLDLHSSHRFKSMTIPDNYIGKTFSDVASYFKEHENALCIGLFIENENVGFGDFLSSDSDALDAFIERKLKEAGHSLSEESKVDVFLNPDNNHIIQSGQGAIVIP
ncbi:MAG: NAD-binding protein [Candidatus Marinimicrobia bacterium]|nr:NAD-binding protein [Candidatus Neomarinimicrobiota bacterium]